MKIKTIVVGLMFIVLSMVFEGLKAQNDMYFNYETKPERRIHSNDESCVSVFNLFDESIGNVFRFNDFGNGLDYDVLYFADFDNEAENAPLDSGLLFLCAAGLMYWWYKKSIKLGIKEFLN
jgi:hypothetical protein